MRQGRSSSPRWKFAPHSDLYTEISRLAGRCWAGFWPRCAANSKLRMLMKLPDGIQTCGTSAWTPVNACAVCPSRLAKFPGCSSVPCPLVSNPSSAPAAAQWTGVRRAPPWCEAYRSPLVVFAAYSSAPYPPALLNYWKPQSRSNNPRMRMQLYPLQVRRRLRQQCIGSIS